MQGKHPDSKPDLPSRVHGINRPAANEQLPRSIWQPGVVQRLADYIRHVREVDQQSDKPHVAGKPDQSGQRHVCKRDSSRSCSCPRGTCADDDATYRHARGPYLVARSDPNIPTPKPNHLGQFRCPISGKLCSEFDCRDWCSGG